MKYALILMFLLLGSQVFAQDPNDLESKRKELAPVIDSLKKEVLQHPDADAPRIALADTYYDAELWSSADTQYEIYLKKNPNDVDARVSLTSVIANTTEDYARALTILKKGLEYDPAHIRANYNVGLFYVILDSSDKKKAAAESDPYFRKAMHGARKDKDYEMFGQIVAMMAQVQDEAEEAK